MHGDSLSDSGLLTNAESRKDATQDIVGRRRTGDGIEGRQRRVKTTLHYHRLQDQDFLQAILEGRPLQVPAEEGRKVVELTQAIYRSGRDRSPVKLGSGA